MEDIQMDKLFIATMSVRQMGALLNLKKTESYRLAHQGYFEITRVEGKMRVVIESFEYWYAGQTHYRKLRGEPPGRRLLQVSYSVRDISVMLQLHEQYVYSLLKSVGLKPVIINGLQRFPKTEFERWYAGQNWYRNREDRQRDAEAEAASLAMPEMARLLGVRRHTVYSILRNQKGKSMLAVCFIAGRKRITKDSFEEWYRSQDRYHKVADDSSDTLRGQNTTQALMPDISCKQPEEPYESKKLITISQAACHAGVSNTTVSVWIKKGYIPVLKLSSHLYRIPRKEFDIFLDWKRDQEQEGIHGIHSKKEKQILRCLQLCILRWKQKAEVGDIQKPR